MKTGRFVAAVGGVWLVRVALNATFYELIVGGQVEKIASAHPGIFRDVIPAYIVADLLFALVFTCLFVKVGGALGGGIRGGVVLGLFVAILSPVLGSIYHYYEVTYLPAGLALADSVFQIVAHGIEGAVAGVIYKAD